MRKSGIALLFVVLVSSAILTAAFAFYGAVERELVVVSSLRNSMKAFYAMEAGSGCVGHWSFRSTEFSQFPPGLIRCNETNYDIDNSDGTNNWVLDLDAPDNTRRVLMEATPIRVSPQSFLGVSGNIKGYNNDLVNSARRMEREKEIHFGHPTECPIDPLVDLRPGEILVDFLTLSTTFRPGLSTIQPIPGCGEKPTPCNCNPANSTDYFPRFEYTCIPPKAFDIIEIPAGQYWVTIVSGDEHHLKAFQIQEEEAFEIEYFSDSNGSGTSAFTPGVSDLPQLCDQLIETVTPVGTPHNIAFDVRSVRVHHTAPVNSGNQHSITAICALFTPITYENPAKNDCRIEFVP